MLKRRPNWLLVLAIVYLVTLSLLTAFAPSTNSLALKQNYKGESVDVKYPAIHAPNIDQHGSISPQQLINNKSQLYSYETISRSRSSDAPFDRLYKFSEQLDEVMGVKSALASFRNIQTRDSDQLARNSEGKRGNKESTNSANGYEEIASNK
jgi:hypothetical protein